MDARLRAHPSVRRWLRLRNSAASSSRVPTTRVNPSSWWGAPSTASTSKSWASRDGLAWRSSSAWAASAFLAQWKIVRTVAAHPELASTADLARALGTSLIVLLVCGCLHQHRFPADVLCWPAGISAALLHHVRRSAALLPQAETLVWRRPSAAPIMLPGVIPGHGGSPS